MRQTTMEACDLLRGVSRALAEADHAVIVELPLRNGRRADMAALDRAGAIKVVEVIVPRRLPQRPQVV